MDVFPFPLFVASLGFQANISNSLGKETALLTGKVPAAGIFLFSSVPLPFSWRLRVWFGFLLLS